MTVFFIKVIMVYNLHLYWNRTLACILSVNFVSCSVKVVSQLLKFLRTIVLWKESFILILVKTQAQTGSYRSLKFLSHDSSTGVPEGLQLYQKETPTQMFSCENCEMFKNRLFYRTPLVAAFVISVFSIFDPSHTWKSACLFAVWPTISSFRQSLDQ